MGEPPVAGQGADQAGGAPGAQEAAGDVISLLNTEKPPEVASYHSTRTLYQTHCGHLARSHGPSHLFLVQF